MSSYAADSKVFTIWVVEYNIYYTVLLLYIDLQI